MPTAVAAPLPRWASSTRAKAPLRVLLASAVVAWLTPGASALYRVALTKEQVPVQVGDRTVAHKTAYFGQVHIGYPAPQTFSVVFDTGSAHFFLPSISCDDPACVQHRRYNRSVSGSAVDINHDGLPFTDDMPERDQVSIAYGTGEIVGEFVKEIVCVGGPASDANTSNGRQSNCASMRLVTALEMTAEPFTAFQFDGVLGLGLEALALDPEFNFFHQLTSGDRLSSMFGVFLARSDDETSEISFGGYDEKRLGGPLNWVPVEAPEFGHWQIRIHGVRIGSEPVDECERELCTAIIDTGTSLLGVPRQSALVYHWKLARQMPNDGEPPTDCRQIPGPQLSFDIGNGMSVDLEAEDYSRPAPMAIMGENNESHSVCRSSLLPVDMEMLGPRVFLWGEPVLKKYFSVFDAKLHRIGLAPAARNPPRAEVPLGQVGKGFLV